MEMNKAIIVQVEEKHFIKIEAKDGEIMIPMSEDKPNEVKKCFQQAYYAIKGRRISDQVRGSRRRSIPPSGERVYQAAKQRDPGSLR